MSAQVIQFESRLVYGRPTLYPINEAAKRLASLTGNKTLKPIDLQVALDLGLEVEEITPKKLNLTRGAK